MKKKILHLVSSLEVGGAEKFVKNLSLEQQQRGDWVKVISFGHKNDPFQAVIEKNGVEVVNLTGNFLARSKLLIHQLKQANIIHIHSPSVIRAILPLFPFFLMKQVIYTIHGEVDPPQSLLAISHQVARLYLNNTVAVSSSAKESVSQRYGWKSQKIGVIKNGINVGSNAKQLTQKITLGVVSRIIPLKNIPMLFDAVLMLPVEVQHNVEIQIFGDGSELDNIKVKAKELSQQIPVSFHGNVIEENDIYNTFDILVMCSDTEGLPMSILEAMGYGIPVISTDVGAIPQVVLAQKTGWLYPVRATAALTDILQEIISDKSIIDKFGTEAQALVKEHYDISMVYRDYNKLYLS